MSTKDAYAVWEEKTMAQGAQRVLAPLRMVLLRLYESRFGPAPAAIRARIEATNDPELMTKWSELMTTAPRTDVDRVLAGA